MLLLAPFFLLAAHSLAAPVVSPQQLTGWGFARPASPSAAHSCTQASVLGGVLVSPSAYYGGQACGSTVFVAQVGVDKQAGPTGQIMVPVVGICEQCASDDLELSPSSFTELVGGTGAGRVQVRWGLLFLS